MKKEDSDCSCKCLRSLAMTSLNLELLSDNVRLKFTGTKPIKSHFFNENPRAISTDSKMFIESLKVAVDDGLELETIRHELGGEKLLRHAKQVVKRLNSKPPDVTDIFNLRDMADALISASQEGCKSKS